MLLQPVCNLGRVPDDVLVLLQYLLPEDEPLLARISGLNQTLAQNIVAYRDENGAFDSRKKLLKVPRLGERFGGHVGEVNAFECVAMKE
ncbi:MAG: helix-hairpin-helix domain-containing protein [Corynebacterium matruchotii]